MKEHLTFEGEDVFLIPSEREGVLLYAPLLKKLFRVDIQLAELISEDGFSSDINHTGLHQITNSLERALETKINPIARGNGNYFHLSLELTRDCTLDCNYCAADAGMKSFMSEELLEEAISQAFEKGKERDVKELKVSYVAGGEATLALPLLKKSVRLLREKEKESGIKTRLAITTNGYYEHEKREYVVRNFDSIALSFDGFKDIQDSQRPTKGGKGSFDKVLDTAKYFNDNLRRFILRSTITENSVKQMNEIVSFFYENVGNNYELNFEPSFPAGRARVGERVSLSREYVQSYIKAKELGKNLGVNVSTSGERSIKDLITIFCGAVGLPSMVVTTGGVVTACEGDADGTIFNYGALKDGHLTVDDEKLANLQQQALAPEYCNPCFIKYHCAGNCPMTREEGRDLCDVNKGLIKYGLEQVLRR
jgi:uncharacterized protein